MQPYNTSRKPYKLATDVLGLFLYPTLPKWPSAHWRGLKRLIGFLLRGVLMCKKMDFYQKRTSNGLDHTAGIAQVSYLAT